MRLCRTLPSRLGLLVSRPSKVLANRLDLRVPTRRLGNDEGFNDISKIGEEFPEIARMRSYQTFLKVQNQHYGKHSITSEQLFCQTDFIMGNPDINIDSLMEAVDASPDASYLSRFVEDSLRRTRGLQDLLDFKDDSVATAAAVDQLFRVAVTNRVAAGSAVSSYVELEQRAGALLAALASAAEPTSLHMKARVAYATMFPKLSRMRATELLTEAIEWFEADLRDEADIVWTPAVAEEGINTPICGDAFLRRREILLARLLELRGVTTLVTAVADCAMYAKEHALSDFERALRLAPDVMLEGHCFFVIIMAEKIRHLEASAGANELFATGTSPTGQQFAHLTMKQSASDSLRWYVDNAPPDHPFFCYCMDELAYTESQEELKNHHEDDRSVAMIFALTMARYSQSVKASKYSNPLLDPLRLPSRYFELLHWYLSFYNELQLGRPPPNTQSEQEAMLMQQADALLWTFDADPKYQELKNRHRAAFELTLEPSLA